LEIPLPRDRPRDVYDYENLGDRRFTTDRDADIETWWGHPGDRLMVESQWYALEIGDPYSITGQIRLFCDPV
jgi:hypothetical protein